LLALLQPADNLVIHGEDGRRKVLSPLPHEHLQRNDFRFFVS
jgi:hypothetical protein